MQESSTAERVKLVEVDEIAKEKKHQVQNLQKWLHLVDEGERVV